MIRRLFIVASVVSLLLCVATVVLWVRSYHIQDTCYVHRSRADSSTTWRADHRGYCIKGQLVWKIATYREPPQPPEVTARLAQDRVLAGLKDFDWRTSNLQGYYFNPATRLDPWWLRWGFRYSHQTLTRPSPNPLVQGFYEIGVPHWSLATIFGLMPLAMALKIWLNRRRRRREGLCPVCGYDLRASTDRCPECGTAVTRNASTLV